MSIDVSQLRSFASLKDFTVEELALLVSAAQRRVFESGSIVVKQGTRGTSSMLLVAGQLDVLREVHGTEQHLTTMAPGAFVGQVALVDRGPRSATLRAKTEVVVLELLRDTFESLLRARSPLALRFQELIAVAGIRQHRAAMKRLASLAAEREHAAQPPRPLDDALAYIQTATSEWDLDLDAIEVVPDATVSRGTRRP